MFRFIGKVFTTAINALMLCIAVPQSYNKLLELTKLDRNDNKIINEIISFFRVFDKYEANNMVMYYYIGVGIIGLSLLMVFISIFTRCKIIYNFLTTLVFIAGVVAFNAIFIYAKIKFA